MKLFQTYDDHNQIVNKKLEDVSLIKFMVQSLESFYLYCTCIHEDDNKISVSVTIVSVFRVFK